MAMRKASRAFHGRRSRTFFSNSEKSSPSGRCLPLNRPIAVFVQVSDTPWFRHCGGATSQWCYIWLTRATFRRFEWP
jgi:hypothetical protein